MDLEETVKHFASQCGLPRVINIIGNLLERENLGIHPRPTDQYLRFNVPLEIQMHIKISESLL